MFPLPASRSRVPRALAAPVFAGLALVFALGAPVGSHPSGQLNLHNDQWARVQVEVRIGATDQCDAAAPAGVRTLASGQVWTVVADGVVCWRREASPGSSDGIWAAWNALPATAGVVQERSL